MDKIGKKASNFAVVWEMFVNRFLNRTFKIGDDYEIDRAWFRGKRYSLQAFVLDDESTSKAYNKVRRYAWVNETGRRCSSFYRTVENATTDFGFFDPLVERLDL